MLPIAFKLKSCSMKVDISLNLEEDCDKVYILELHIRELRKQGLAWKPHN